MHKFIIIFSILSIFIFQVAYSQPIMYDTQNPDDGISIGKEDWLRSSYGRYSNTDFTYNRSELLLDQVSIATPFLQLNHDNLSLDIHVHYLKNNIFAIYTDKFGNLTVNKLFFDNNNTQSLIISNRFNPENNDLLPNIDEDDDYDLLPANKVVDRKWLKQVFTINNIDNPAGVNLTLHNAFKEVTINNTVINQISVEDDLEAAIDYTAYEALFTDQHIYKNSLTIRNARIKPSDYILSGFNTIAISDSKFVAPASSANSKIILDYQVSEFNLTNVVVDNTTSISIGNDSCPTPKGKCSNNHYISALNVALDNIEYNQQLSINFNNNLFYDPGSADYRSTQNLTIKTDNLNNLNNLEVNFNRYEPDNTITIEGLGDDNGDMVFNDSVINSLLDIKNIDTLAIKNATMHIYNVHSIIGNWRQNLDLSGNTQDTYKSNIELSSITFIVGSDEQTIPDDNLGDVNSLTLLNVQLESSNFTLGTDAYVTLSSVQGSIGDITMYDNAFLNIDSFSSFTDANALTISALYSKNYYQPRSIDGAINAINIKAPGNDIHIKIDNVRLLYSGIELMEGSQLVVGSINKSDLLSTDALPVFKNGIYGQIIVHENSSLFIGSVVKDDNGYYQDEDDSFARSLLSKIELGANSTLRVGGSKLLQVYSLVSSTSNTSNIEIDISNSASLEVYSIPQLSHTNIEIKNGGRLFLSCYSEYEDCTEGANIDELEMSTGALLNLDIPNINIEKFFLTINKEVTFMQVSIAPDFGSSSSVSINAAAWSITNEAKVSVYVSNGTSYINHTDSKSVLAISVQEFQGNDVNFSTLMENNQINVSGLSELFFDTNIENTDNNITITTNRKRLFSDYSNQYNSQILKVWDDQIDSGNINTFTRSIFNQIDKSYNEKDFNTFVNSILPIHNDILYKLLSSNNLIFDEALLHDISPWNYSPQLPGNLWLHYDYDKLTIKRNSNSNKVQQDTSNFSFGLNIKNNSSLFTNIGYGYSMGNINKSDSLSGNINTHHFGVSMYTSPSYGFLFGSSLSYNHSNLDVTKTITLIDSNAIRLSGNYSINHSTADGSPVIYKKSIDGKDVMQMSYDTQANIIDNMWMIGSRFNFFRWNVSAILTTNISLTILQDYKEKYINNWHYAEVDGIHRTLYDKTKLAFNITREFSFDNQISIAPLFVYAVSYNINAQNHQNIYLHTSSTDGSYQEQVAYDRYPFNNWEQLFKGELKLKLVNRGYFNIGMTYENSKYYKHYTIHMAFGYNI